MHDGTVLLELVLDGSLRVVVKIPGASCFA
jgi:hypothetical protein